MVDFPMLLRVIKESAGNIDTVQDINKAPSHKISSTKNNAMK